MSVSVFTCVFTGVSLQLCVRVAYMLTLCAWVGVPYACVHVLLCVCMSARTCMCVHVRICVIQLDNVVCVSVRTQILVH